MNEAFLHYVWKYRLLKDNLTTTDGVEVAVDSVGEYNSDAGPDFFNAHIRMGGMQWIGNIEIHKSSSDWYLHKHHLDKKYNNVVLHIVYNHDREVFLENGNSLPTVQIKDYIRDGVWEKYQELLQPSISANIPCIGHLKDLTPFYISAYLERMATERLERKSKDIKDILVETKNSWEECCYRIFARYFGGKVNALPFELLAKSIPLNLYAKVRTSPFQIEALMFGQSGMLEADFVDAYPLALKQEYEYLRKAYNLTAIEGYLWKFFRLRPSSFPTLRISQFALLIARSKSLFSKLLEAKNFEDVMSLLDVEASEYWDNHYHFDKESKSKRKTTGRAFTISLIINAWVPLLFEYGSHYGIEKHKDMALRLLEQMDAEHNGIVSLWADGDLVPGNALQSQALIEIYNEYCKKKRCLECNIGYKVINRK